MSTRPPIPGDAGRLYFWIRKQDLRAREVAAEQTGGGIRIWDLLSNTK